jgi:NADH-quinone oxidoreductase subunit C
MIPQQFFEKLQADEIPGVEEFMEGTADHAIRVDPDQLPDILAYLKDDPDCLLDQLSLLSGTQYEDRFECVYHLLSIKHKHDLVIKVHLDQEDPHVPTVSDVHPTADWHERETYDLVGIQFDGHPDPRRIYLPEGWEGHPLRRDYEFPTEYDGFPLLDVNYAQKEAEEKAAAASAAAAEADKAGETDKKEDA